MRIPVVGEMGLASVIRARGFGLWVDCSKSLEWTKEEDNLRVTVIEHFVPMEICAALCIIIQDMSYQVAVETLIDDRCIRLSTRNSFLSYEQKTNYRVYDITMMVYNAQFTMQVFAEYEEKGM